MKDALYFSHDSNARHDPKITAMRGVYGSEGYGWYWMFIEMMREAEGYKLDMRSKYAFNAYAMQMQCERIAIESFVHDCINEFDLFQSDEVHFWSESLLRRMKIKDEKSKKAQESANARWKKCESNANALKSDANASKNDAYKKGNKEKESKDNKTSTPKIAYAENVFLSEKEYNKLCEDYGNELTKRSIEYLSSYKIEKAYKTKSDNLTIRRWVVEAVSKSFVYNPQKEVSATKQKNRLDEQPEFEAAEPPVLM